MMQYKVVNADHLRSLEALVNLNILNGWTPSGGVFCHTTEPRESPIYELSSNKEEIFVAVSSAPTKVLWSQAMIK